MVVATRAEEHLQTPTLQKEADVASPPTTDASNAATSNPDSSNAETTPRRPQVMWGAIAACVVLAVITAGVVASFSWGPTEVELVVNENEFRAEDSPVQARSLGEGKEQETPQHKPSTKPKTKIVAPVTREKKENQIPPADAAAKKAAQNPVQKLARSWSKNRQAAPWDHMLARDVRDLDNWLRTLPGDQWPEIRQRSERGDAVGQWIRGMYYWDYNQPCLRNGVAAANANEALYWTHQAQAQGLPAAQYQWAISLSEVHQLLFEANPSEGHKLRQQWYKDTRWQIPGIKQDAAALSAEVARAMKEAAEGGYPAANYQLYVWYEYGAGQRWGVGKDADRARTHLSRAVAGGDVYATWWQYLRKGQSELEACATIANSGDFGAMLRLAETYQFGSLHPFTGGRKPSAVPVDFGQAIRWYQRAVAHPLAGTIGPATHERAAEMYALGGKNLARNSQKAATILERHCNQLMLKADAVKFADRIAKMPNNRGNNAAEFFWRHTAARMGDRTSQRIVSGMYYDGKGVRKNVSSAFYWVKKAADAGDDKARYYAGWHLVNGYGCREDLRKALYYFESIRDRTPKVTNRIGSVYWLLGKRATGRRYIAQAAREGHEGSKKLLAILDNPSSAAFSDSNLEFGSRRNGEGQIVDKYGNIVGR